MSGQLLQAEPRECDGAASVVFDHLIQVDIRDPSAISRMTREQQFVFAINHLRQEVHSGGFDVYLRYSGGNTLLLAREALTLLGPEWVALVQDVLEMMRSPYPLDVDERETRLDELLHDRPGLLDGFNDRLYDLEDAAPVDEHLDQFVWAHKASFFK